MPLSLSGSGGITYPDGSVNTTRSVSTAGDTINGNLIVNAGNQSFRVQDTNGYARFTHQSGSAQIGLFRSGTNIGGGYIGADDTNCLDIRTADFTTRMTVDQAGRVRMPFQPAFHAYRDSALTGSNQVGVWNLTRFNTGSHYSTSTGRFTAPVAGAYMFSVTALPNSTSNGVFYYVRKNASGWGPTTYIINPDETVSASSIVSMSAGDYVDVFIQADGTEGSYTAFCGFLIG
jgi:hypothetical protein